MAHPASYTMCTGSFPGGKRPGRGVDHPPQFSPEDKETVEVYLYSSSGLSWPVLGWTCPYFLPVTQYKLNSSIITPEFPPPHNRRVCNYGLNKQHFILKVSVPFSTAGHSLGTDIKPKDIDKIYCHHIVSFYFTAIWYQQMLQISPGPWRPKRRGR